MASTIARRRRAGSGPNPLLSLSFNRTFMGGVLVSQGEPTRTFAAMLQRLIYASRLCRGVEQDTAPVLQDILSASVRNNIRHRVTGLLIAHDGWFLQALEGPAAGLRHVFDKIADDGRHTKPSILQHGPVESRAFGRWVMSGRVLCGLDHAILGRFGMQRSFDPVSPTCAPVMPLLLELARTHVRALDSQHEHLSTRVRSAA